MAKEASVKVKLFLIGGLISPRCQAAYGLLHQASGKLIFPVVLNACTPGLCNSLGQQRLRQGGSVATITLPPKFNAWRLSLPRNSISDTRGREANRD
jgi:hypothetical protein